MGKGGRKAVRVRPIGTRRKSNHLHLAVHS